MREKGKPTGPRAAKRGVWFFMRTMVFVVALIFLCYGIFTMAMNATNLYIIATEGLQLRAECVLQDGPREDLKIYFTENFIKKDEVLNSTIFEDYNITSFDYRVSVEGLQAWPWQNSATLTVVDRMASMNGSMYDDKKPEGAAEDAVYPLPEWEGGRYKLHFSKRDGRWYIYQMQLLEATPSEEPLRTPNMSITPRPAHTTPPPSTTPTPRVTATPTPSATPSPTPEEEEE